MVLRGVEPFHQFFVAAYDKRAQFEAFDEKSGAQLAVARVDGRACSFARAHRRCTGRGSASETLYPLPPASLILPSFFPRAPLVLPSCALFAHR